MALPLPAPVPELAGRVELTIAEVEREVRATRRAILNWYKAGTFPTPHYLDYRRLWWLDEILAWKAARIARAPEERRLAPPGRSAP